MAIEWLASSVLFGLAVLAVPIAIHLFAQTPVRRVVVPSLRLVDPRVPRLRRRRRLRDRLLLAVRLTILTAAVLASAGPLIVSPARQARWAARTVRAIVVDNAVRGPAIDAAVAAEQVGATASSVIAADPVEGGIAASLAWLSSQPPARQEVVFVGDGASVPSAPVAARIPAAVGIRMHRVDDAGTDAEVRHWLGNDDDGVRRDLRLSRTASSEAPVTTAATTLPLLPVTLRAAEADRAVVEAVWEGIVAEGLFLRPAETWQPFEIEWAGAEVVAADSPGPLTAQDRLVLWPLAQVLVDGTPLPEVALPWIGVGPDVAAARDGDKIRLRVTRAAEPGRAATVLRAALAIAAGEQKPPRRMREVDAVTAAAVERPSGGAPDGATRFEGSRDGRWLWLLAVVGLIAEQALRRRQGAQTAAADGSAWLDDEVTR